MHALINHIKGDVPSVPVDEGLGKSLATGLLATSLLVGVPTPNADAQPKTQVVSTQKGSPAWHKRFPRKFDTSLANIPKQNIDIEVLLRAIKQKETRDGQILGDRYEPNTEARLRRSNLDKLHRTTKNAILKYGYTRLAKSYGLYQVMGETAYDLQFTGAPEDLRKPELSREYAEKYVKFLIARPMTKTLADVISGYNAGTGGIGNNPDYTAEVLHFYKKYR